MIRLRILTPALLCVFAFLAPAHVAAVPPPNIASIVRQAVEPVMQRYDIPGIAVGIVVNGRTHIYNFGVASRATRQPVKDTTLFEVGSVSKTFTATLASYAQVHRQHLAFR